jgi:hypothetical protein
MSHDYIALEWVKGEIEETLQQAQQALETYVENMEDRTHLKLFELSSSGVWHFADGRILRRSIISRRNGSFSQGLG